MSRGKAKTAETTEQRTNAGLNPKILVVNDEEGSCELLCRILANAGHPVERAANPDQAISIIDVLRPGCVVLDLSSGGIARNLQVLDAIRSQLDQVVASTRVVLVAHQTSNRMFSWQAGTAAFLARPFPANDLVKAVAAALARPHRRRAGCPPPGTAAAS